MADNLSQRFGKQIFNKTAANYDTEKYRKNMCEQWVAHQDKCSIDMQLPTPIPSKSQAQRSKVQSNHKTKKLITKRKPTSELAMPINKVRHCSNKQNGSHTFFSIGKNYDEDVFLKNVDTEKERDFQLIFEKEKPDNRNRVTLEKDNVEIFPLFDRLRARCDVERHRKKVIGNVQPQSKEKKRKQNYDRRHFSGPRGVELQSVNNEHFEFDDKKFFLQNNDHLNKHLRLQQNVSHMKASDEFDLNMKHMVKNHFQRNIQHESITHRPHSTVFNIKCNDLVIKSDRSFL